MLFAKQARPRVLQTRYVGASTSLATSLQAASHLWVREEIPCVPGHRPPRMATPETQEGQQCPF